ncbi:hypothetical protein ABK040_016703 [Willaertia magna]
MKQLSLILLTIIILISLQITFISSLPPFTFSSVNTVRTTWPETQNDVFDGARWVEYGIYLAIIFAVILILGLISYCVGCWFCCLRCCGFCGGCTTKGQTDRYPYTPTDVKGPALIFLLLYIVILIFASLGIIFSVLFSSSLRTVVKESSDSISTLNTMLNKTNNLGQIVSNQVYGIINKLDPYIQEVNTFQQPLTNIQTSLQNGITTLDNFNSTTGQTINSHVNVIRSDLQIIRDNNDVQNAPDPNTIIPDINGQLANSINQGKTYLNQGIQQVTTIKTTLDNNVQTTKDQLNNTLKNNVVPNIETSLSGVTNFITTLQNDYLNPYFNQKSVDDGTYWAYVGENIRLALEITFFGFIFFLYLFTLIGICIKKAIPIECSYVCTFLFAWLFFIVAAFQIPLFIFVQNACHQGPTTAKTVANAALDGGNLNINGIQVNVTNAIDNIFSCRGNGSLIQAILGEDYLKQFNIDTMISDITNQVNNQLQNFNISNTAGQVNNYVTQSNIQNVRTDYTSDVNNALESLHNTTKQFNDYSNFNGFNYTTYNGALNNLNNFASNYGYYYTYENVTLFDPNKSPYNQSTSTRDAATDLKTKVDQQIDLYNSTVQEVLSLNNTANRIESNLNNLKGDFVIANNDLAGVKSLPNSITNDVNSLVHSVNNFITNTVNSLQPTITGIVYDMVNAIGTEIAGCAFIGRYGSTLGDQVCNKMSYQTILTALVSLFIGITMMAMFMVLLVVGKKVRYQNKVIKSFEDIQDNVATAQQELPEKH